MRMLLARSAELGAEFRTAAAANSAPYLMFLPRFSAPPRGAEFGGGGLEKLKNFTMGKPWGIEAHSALSLALLRVNELRARPYNSAPSPSV